MNTRNGYEGFDGDHQYLSREWRREHGMQPLQRDYTLDDVPTARLTDQEVDAARAEEEHFAGSN